MSVRVPQRWLACCACAALPCHLSSGRASQSVASVTHQAWRDTKGGLVQLKCRCKTVEDAVSESSTTINCVTHISPERVFSFALGCCCCCTGLSTSTGVESTQPMNVQLVAGTSLLSNPFD
eukprot:scaffold207_cov409-Prasinococcus_capsulatus_cf.AAC.98